MVADDLDALLVRLRATSVVIVIIVVEVSHVAALYNQDRDLKFQVYNFELQFLDVSNVNC